MLTVYTKPNCVQCLATKRKLQALGVPYKAVNLTTSPKALELVKSLGYLTAPVVVASDGKHWGGFQPERLAEYAQ